MRASNRRASIAAKAAPLTDVELKIRLMRVLRQESNTLGPSGWSECEKFLVFHFSLDEFRRAF